VRWGWLSAECDWHPVAGSMVQPLQVWTVRVQHTRPGTSIWGTLLNIWHEGGLGAFFKSASVSMHLSIARRCHEAPGAESANHRSSHVRLVGVSGAGDQASHQVRRRGWE
jgi:hypothetical protein